MNAVSTASLKNGAGGGQNYPPPSPQPWAHFQI